MKNACVVDDETLSRVEPETHFHRRIIDDFGANSLITGRVVETLVAEDALRDPDRDDAEIFAANPLLVYLAPGRYAEVRDTLAFPFHAGWSR